MLKSCAVRFSYFCRASLDYIVKCGKQPDILHLHNWETAIVAPLFWDVFVNKVSFLNFNFHNLCIGIFYKASAIRRILALIEGNADILKQEKEKIHFELIVRKTLNSTTDCVL